MDVGAIPIVKHLSESGLSMEKRTWRKVSPCGVEVHQNDVYDIYALPVLLIINYISRNHMYYFSGIYCSGLERYDGAHV